MPYVPVGIKETKKKQQKQQQHTDSRNGSIANFCMKNAIFSVSFALSLAHFAIVYSEVKQMF